MNWEAFFTLHRDLPREGPGEISDIEWAAQHTDLAEECRISDLACGPGADLQGWAQVRPRARITGVEKHSHFVAQAQARVAAYGDRVTARTGDMADPGGPYDLIWCAGAIYFMGVSEGLRTWRTALAPGGAVVFSEPVWLTADPAPLAVSHWAEYPAMTDVAGLDARIKAAGYTIEKQRVLSDAAWENYFTPIDARIARLRQGPVDADLAEVLADAEAEAAIWRQHRCDFGYMLSIVRPE